MYIYKRTGRHKEFYTMLKTRSNLSLPAHEPKKPAAAIPQPRLPQRSLAPTFHPTATPRTRGSEYLPYTQNANMANWAWDISHFPQIHLMDSILYCQLSFQRVVLPRTCTSKVQCVQCMYWLYNILHNAFCLPTASSITCVILSWKSVEAVFSQVPICCQSEWKIAIVGDHRGVDHPSSHCIKLHNRSSKFHDLIRDRPHKASKEFASDLRFRFLHSETRKEFVFPTRPNYLVEFS